MAREIKEGTSTRKGLTKIQWKRTYGSSTKGIDKGDNCRASGLKKGVIIYPRWYKKDPVLYMRIMAQTDKAAKGRKTLSGGTLKINKYAN